MPAPEVAAEEALRRWYVTVPMTTGEVDLCRRHGASAELGGASNVRPIRGDRMESLSEDQLVGMVGNLAGCKWLFGKSLGHYLFRVTRWAADRTPDRGDGGEDVPGGNLDFKTSLIRDPDRPLERYRLAVRPRERHAGTVYVLALVAADYSNVYLLGWAMDAMLPPVDEDGPFQGASTIPVPELHRCMPLEWKL